MTIAHGWGRPGGALLAGLVALAACTGTVGGGSGGHPQAGTTSTSSSTTASTTSAGGGGTGGGTTSTTTTTTTTATSAGGGGTGGAATSSSSSSSATTGSGGAGGTDVVDCSALAGAGPGDVLWSTTFPAWAAPSMSNVSLAVGTTARSFVAVTYRFIGSGMMPAGVDVHEVDGTGAYVGKPGSIAGGSQDIPDSTFAVFDAHHFVANAGLDDWGAFGNWRWYVASDDGNAGATGIPNTPVPSPPPPPYAVAFSGKGNVAGDLFIGSAGVSENSTVTRVDKSGATVFTKTLPASPAFGGLWPDDTGNVYIRGQNAGGLDVGCGPMAGTGVYLAKLDPSGQCVWSRALDGAVVPAGSGVYLTGSFTGTLDLGCGPMTAASGGSSYVALLDAAGACTWNKSFVGDLEMALLPSGSPVISSSFTGTVDVGCGPLTSSSTSALVTVLGPSGICVWSRSFDVAGVGVAAFPSGDVAVSTSPKGSVDFGGGPLMAVGTQDLALARLDGATGAHVWSRIFGAPGASLWANVIPDQSGGVLLVGRVTGTIDFGGGPIVSDPPMSCTTNYECPSGWCLNASCHPVGSQPYVLKLDAAGAFRWQRGSGTAALDPCGAVVYADPCFTCAPGNASGVTLQRLAP